MELVHVISFTLIDQRTISDALAHLRRLSARSSELRCPVMLFCDLPDASCRKKPEEDFLIRTLLSGVMSMNAQQKNSFFVLVRSRVWDDAARQYLGSTQPLSLREVIAHLLLHGETSAAFEAASIAPASMKGRWNAALFSDSSLSCTPDIPSRMANYLQTHGLSAACALVLPHRSYPRSALARLLAISPFSLSALHSARTYALAQHGLGSCEQPALYTLEALSHLKERRAMPVAPHCAFIHRRAPSSRSILLAYRTLCRMHPLSNACIPLVQFALFAASAILGLSPLAAAALLPEIWTLMHPRAWPGVLLRTALVPMTALFALDTLLCRLLARSPLLRLRIPELLLSPFSCLFSALALLPAAVYSTHALTAVLPVLFLWLSVPLFFSALDRPTVERIPLSDTQQAQLRTLTESAYFTTDASSPPPLRMLCACAGCMLGLLETDEAAREVQLLAKDLQSMNSAYEQAAVLACAQFLRERMSKCDAALRALPDLLETHVLSTQESDVSSILGVLMQAVRTEHMPDFANVSSAVGLDLLFLPLRPAAQMQLHPLSLPLTHPHTFLRRQLLSSEAGASPEASPQSPAEHFLFLAAAALEHPFYALLLRSPVAGAYAEALFSAISFP